MNTRPVSQKEIDRLERLIREAGRRMLAVKEDSEKTGRIPTIRVEIDATDQDDCRALRVTAMMKV